MCGDFHMFVCDCVLNAMQWDQTEMKSVQWWETMRAGGGKWYHFYLNVWTINMDFPLFYHSRHDTHEIATKPFRSHIFALCSQPHTFESSRATLQYEFDAMRCQSWQRNSNLDVWLFSQEKTLNSQLFAATSIHCFSLEIGFEITIKSQIVGMSALNIIRNVLLALRFISFCSSKSFK